MIRKLITIFVIIIIYSNIYSASYEEIHEHNLQFIKNLNVDEIENLKKFTLETYEREIKEIENFTQKINSLQDEIKIYAESYDYEIDYYYYEFKLEEFEIDKHIDVLESTENDIFSEHMLPYLLKNKINTINDTKREIKNTTKQDFLHIKNSIHWDYYSWLGMNSNNYIEKYEIKYFTENEYEIIKRLKIITREVKIFEKKILSLPINKLESEINEINSKEFIEFIKEGRNEFDRIFIFNVSDLYIEEKKEEKIRNLEESIEFLKEEIIYYEDEEMTYFLEKQIQEESELIDKIELMSNEEFEKDYIPYFFISEEEIKEEVIEEINYDTDGKYINEIRENYPSEFEKKIYILEKQLANPNEKEYILNQIDILNKEIEFYKSQSQEEIMNKEIKEFRIIGKLLDGRYFSDLRFSSYIIIDSKFEKIEYTDEEVEELRNDTILELERRIDVLKVILEIYNDEYINDQISYIENEIELIKIQSIETLRSKFFYERIPFIPTNISNITETIITENIIINQTNVSNITETIITENITSEIVNNSIRDNIINKTEVVVENIKNISEKIIEQIKDDTNENNKSLNLIETDNKEEIVKNDKDNPIQSINKLNQNTNKLNESSIKNSKKDENTNFFITQFNSVTEFFSNLFNFFRE